MIKFAMLIYFFTLAIVHASTCFHDAKYPKIITDEVNGDSKGYTVTANDQAVFVGGFLKADNQLVPSG